LDSELTIRGAMRVGATYTFKPIEMYMPNTDETKSKAEASLGELKKEEGFQPDFKANVEANVRFDVLVTPEVNLGIKIGGGMGAFKVRRIAQSESSIP
jgi:hypothetical protein